MRQPPAMQRNGRPSVRRSVSLAALGFLALARPPAARAQETPPAPADEEPGGEAAPVRREIIVITGSRIRTDPLNAPSPVLQVGQEDIDRSGLTAIGDLLQRLPVSGGAINTRFNSSGNFGFPPDGGGIGAGAAEADLRYLGSKRVLILVDGVRWVSGSSGSGVPVGTDLNTIPIGMIDRVEVLEDGASPIYGSDAIGGVINIITKKEFSGSAANAYVGGYQQRDGVTQQYDVIWGNRTDRMTTTLSVSYVDQQRISSGARSISRYPIPGLDTCTSSCSSGTPQGRFQFVDPNTGQEVDVTLNKTAPGPDGTISYDPLYSGGGMDDFKRFETTDRFNFAPYNLVLTPSQRVGVFSGIEYKLTPRTTGRARVLFNNRESVNQAAPEPIFIGPEAGNGNRLDRISVDQTNPYNPFGFTLDAQTNPYFIGRRPLEAGPRIFEQAVNTWYVSGSLQGDLDAGESHFYWDATAVYSINRADQIKHGAFSAAKLEKALGPVDVCNADPDCVPFNIFGGQGPDGLGTITKEMLNYVTFVQKDVSQQQLLDLVANVAGELIELPGGTLSIAAGLEHRELSGFFEPDSVVAAGDSAGIPAKRTSGSYQVNEAYGEVRVPLLADTAWADLLDLSGAVRVSQYSTFGLQRTFKAGARWRPTGDLLLRTNYAQGFRAPGIGELFGSDARFDQTMRDPCSDMLGAFGGTPAPQSVVDSCVALGIPADGSYVQFNPQISVTTGGNKELEPETSDTVTVSLVYSPTWLAKNPAIDKLDVELTYYRIDLDRAIQAPNAQVQLDLCVQTLDPAFCDGISRTSGGVINRFANRLTNIGGIATDGVDLTLRYLVPPTGLGRFRVTSLSSFLNRFDERIRSSMGFESVARAGTEIGDPERAFPRFKSSLFLDWFQREWRASFTARYIHSIREQCRGLSAFPGLCSDPNLEDDNLSANKLDAIIYNDVQVGWAPQQLDSRLNLTLGVNNIFNRSPPKCYSCALNGFDATTYDVPGMFAYLRASYRM